MISRNCHIKNFDTIEVLGDVSCFLSSKTGVLTQNSMTVATLWMDNKIVDVDYHDDHTSDDIPYTKTPGWKNLSRVASLCNNAEFMDGDRHPNVLRRETIGGNATDASILKCTEHNMR